MTVRTLFQDKITIGGWTFNDDTSLPTGVTQAGMNVLDGWDDAAPFDALISSKGSRDGDVPSEHFPLRSRIVTLGGWLYCTSRTTAMQARTSLFATAFPMDTDLTLIRYEPDAAKQCTVRVTTPVTIPPETNATGPHFRFQVTVQAMDPLKYAATSDLAGTTGIAGGSVGGLLVPVVLPATFETASGQLNQISVNNVGSHDSKPVTTIHGPLPTGWRWSNDTTGETLLLDVSLTVGDTLVLNHQTETATLNGTVVSPVLTGTWWALRRGINLLRLFGEYDEDASVSVAARSAWR